MAIERPELEPLIKFRPEIFNFDLTKKEQDRRAKRRISRLQNLIRASENEGFKTRTRNLIELYEKNLEKGTEINPLADTVFIQGIIRSLDHETGEYWRKNLEKIKKKLPKKDPSIEDLDKLIDILPITFPHIALKEGLAEKVDSMIRKCKDPSTLLNDINKTLTEAEHGSIETLVDDYRERRLEQLKSAPKGFYWKIMLGLDKIFEGLVVPPSGVGVGGKPKYQLKRLKRRLKAFEKTDLVKDPTYAGFMEKFRPILKTIKKEVYKSDFGRALMAQAMNIYLSTLAKDWMDEKINLLSVPGTEEAISDLRNISETLSHIGRRRGLVPKIVEKINLSVKEVEALPREDAVRRIEELRNDLNKTLIGETYKSHSGIKKELMGPLPTLFSAYEKEHLYLLGKINRNEIVELAREALKGKRKTHEIKDSLYTVVNSDKYGLAEAEAITRRIMDSKRVKNFSKEDREELEEHIGDLFRERRSYIRNLNELLRIFVEATLGAGKYETFKWKVGPSIPDELLVKEPKVRKLISKVLSKDEKDVNVEDVKTLGQDASFAHTTIEHLDKLWFPTSLGEEEEKVRGRELIRDSLMKLASMHSKSSGIFRDIINPIVKRGHILTSV
jgi:hypothetical protein